MSNRKQGKGFLLGALAGSIAGSVAALLLAPKAGKELRHDISEGAHKVKEQAVSAAGQVGDRAGRVAKQAREQAVQFADKTKLTVTGLRLRITGSEETKLEEVLSDGRSEEAAAEKREQGDFRADHDQLELPDINAAAREEGSSKSAFEPDGKAEGQQETVGAGRNA